MKSKKRLLSVILSAIIASSVVTTSLTTVFADETTQLTAKATTQTIMTQEEFERNFGYYTYSTGYNYNDNNYNNNRYLYGVTQDNGYSYNYYRTNPESTNVIAICEYNGNDTDVVVPSIVDMNGTYCRVIAITAGAFAYDNDSYTYNRRNIRNIELPSTLEFIGERAFCNLFNLIDINIPDGVKVIGNYAFAGCSSLRSIDIPDSVEYLGCFAFSIYDIPYDNNNDYYPFGGIEYNYYMSAANLRNVSLGSGLKKIQAGTFCGCIGLVNVRMGANIKTIGEGAFYHCENLKSIDIPDNTTLIDNQAFYYCRSLANVNLGKNVRYINNEAFYSCESLTDIIFPDSVRNIGYEAFTQCYFLENISLPDGNTSIESYAFGGTAVKNLYIPAGITNLSENDAFAFENCSNLQYIEVDENNKNYSSNDGILYNKKGTVEICRPPKKDTVNTLTLSEQATTISVGDTFTLATTLTPANENVTYTWSSSDPTVATVDNSGNVTALNDGKTVIKVKSSNGLTASCTVTVSPLPESVQLSQTNIALAVNQSYTLIATQTPDNAIQNYQWSSDNPEVATVNSNGKVTAVSTGTAVITLRTTNGKVADCTVEVGADIERVTFTRKSAVMYIGQTYTPTFTTTPSSPFATYKWSSSDNNVATVSSTGEITAVGIGEAKIRIKSHNGKSATFTATVKALPESISFDKENVTLEIEDTYNLVTSLNPDGAFSVLKWESSDTDIATVDTNGKITAYEEGVTVITASTPNGLSTSCTVTVTPKKTITLNKTTLSIGVSEQYVLISSIFPEDNEVTYTYKSNNATVASVNKSGRVVGRAEGTATITVIASNGLRTSCEVTVTPKKVLTLDKTNLEMTVKEQYTLRPTLIPNDTEVTYTYKSNNATVATVNKSGRVVARGTGSAVITVIASNGLKTTCTVTVQ